MNGRKKISITLASALIVIAMLSTVLGVIIYYWVVDSTVEVKPYGIALFDGETKISTFDFGQVEPEIPISESPDFELKRMDGLTDMLNVVYIVKYPNGTELDQAVKDTKTVYYIMHNGGKIWIFCWEYDTLLSQWRIWQANTPKNFGFPKGVRLAVELEYPSEYIPSSDSNTPYVFEFVFEQDTSV